MPARTVAMIGNWPTFDRSIAMPSAAATRVVNGFEHDATLREPFASASAPFAKAQSQPGRKDRSR